MGILWLFLIFASLASHGHVHAQSPEICHRGGGFCRVGYCDSGEYPTKYCFEPVILCCKKEPSTT
ncbi:Gallinacin-12, partial [Chaetura pelagica]